MKTNTKLAAIIIGLTFMFACSTDDKIFPSSTVTTDERIVENYDGIEVSSAFTVDIEFSDTEELIEIEANKNLQQFIIVEKSNGKLKIKAAGKKIVFSNSGEFELESNPDNKRDQIFQRFYKNSQSSNSSGLGLAIVKKVCELNDIEIYYRFQNFTHQFILEF